MGNAPGCSSAASIARLDAHAPHEGRNVQPPDIEALLGELARPVGQFGLAGGLLSG